MDKRRSVVCISGREGLCWQYEGRWEDSFANMAKEKDEIERIREELCKCAREWVYREYGG